MVPLAARRILAGPFGPDTDRLVVFLLIAPASKANTLLSPAFRVEQVEDDRNEKAERVEAVEAIVDLIVQAREPQNGGKADEG